MATMATAAVDTLSRVIISAPSLIHLDAAANGTAPPRSWIQLARVGSFTSNRYGKFSITRDDLAQMLKNFNEVTPKAPTELPVDYDHLSMDAKRPGDGIAAGWMKKLELRDNGDSLFAEVEWTPEGAARIANREYRFVSPSFVKDHTHKDGTKIGTTLLAAAITNHPFLEQMKALTLYNFSAMGDLALTTPPAPRRAPMEKPMTMHLAEAGQVVTFLDDADATPELTPEERAQSFVVKSVVGEGGDDQFVRLATAEGEEFGWYRATQLKPAEAPTKDDAGPLPTNTVPTAPTTMADTMAAAARFVLLVQRYEHQGLTSLDATRRASSEMPDAAESYRAAGMNLHIEREPAPVFTLSAKFGEDFDQLAMRIASEKKIPLRQAIHEVGQQRPDLARQR